MLIILRYCVKCKNYKSIENFGKNPTNKDGLQSYCRKCQYKLKKRWRKNNPNKRRKITARYRKKHSAYIKNYLRSYFKTEHGKDVRRRIMSKRKGYGFCKLIENDWNCAIEWHHVNNNDVVPLPRNLHRMCNNSDKKVHRKLANKLVNILYEGELKVGI
jgi:hypothetical protein